jgi:hypothetical protein
MRIAEIANGLAPILPFAKGSTALNRHLLAIQAQPLAAIAADNSLVQHLPSRFAGLGRLLAAPLNST